MATNCVVFFSDVKSVMDFFCAQGVQSTASQNGHGWGVT